MSDSEFDVAAYVKQAAAIGGYTITAAQLPGVQENVLRIMGAAKLVLEFPLPDDVELASVFKP